MLRIDANKSILENAYNIPVQIFANAQVKVEPTALKELETLLALAATIENIHQQDPDFFGQAASIEQVAITPDFHKGKGIPIGTTLKTKGFVVPQAIGKDVNCGMRLYHTDLQADDIMDHLDDLKKAIRYVYFQGGRNIPISPNQKKALLQYGLTGLLETAHETDNKGLWNAYDKAQQEKDLKRVIDHGSLYTDGIFEGLSNYAKHDYVTYDSQIGSIGGGNHFVEVQRIKKIYDGATAYHWGLKEGAVVVMIHTGSVSVGYPTANHFVDILKKVYPPHFKHPQNKIYPLPISQKHQAHWNDFWQSLYNGANFAFCNRLFLGLMMQKVMRDQLGSCDFKLLYDSGHNMLWEEKDEEGNPIFIHRKGACPARGPEQLQGTPFEWTGEPVLIPGSMGASSFILAGNGCADSLCSASHGAGRALSRGDSLKVDDQLFEKFMKQFHIITPIDPNDHQIRGRQDILDKWKSEIKKEAPFAFKDISAVIQTQTDSGVGRLVAEVEPIFTVKG